VTAREALEHLAGSHGFAAFMADSLTKKSEEAELDPWAELEKANPKQPRFLGGGVLDKDGESVLTPSGLGKKGQITVRGPKAAAIADKPHLTVGTESYWKEWDDLELAETDPSKPDLKIRW